MSDLFLLSEAQMRRIEPYFPLSHGIALVDDGMVTSGIVFFIKNGLRWRDAPRVYGPTRRSITGSSGGAGWAYLTRYSQNWLVKRLNQSG